VVYEGDLGVVLVVCGLCGYVDDLRGGGFDEGSCDREGVEGEVASLGGDPFFVLFAEHGADEADDAIGVGKMFHAHPQTKKIKSFV
jgi:hypothetical protein